MTKKPPPKKNTHTKTIVGEQTCFLFVFILYIQKQLNQRPCPALRWILYHGLNSLIPPSPAPVYPTEKILSTLSSLLSVIEAHDRKKREIYKDLCWRSKYFLLQGQLNQRACPRTSNRFSLTPPPSRSPVYPTETS